MVKQKEDIKWLVRVFSMPYSNRFAVTEEVGEGFRKEMMYDECRRPNPGELEEQK